MVIPSLMSRIRAGENPLTIWGDGSAIRDFAFSRDIAIGILQAMVFGTKGRYINLGSGILFRSKSLLRSSMAFGFRIPI